MRNKAASALEESAQSSANASHAAARCFQDCPAMSRVVKKYMVKPVDHASTQYDAFYKKHINVMGIAVLSSNQVSDCGLKKAAWMVHGILSHIKRWPEIVAEMKAVDSRVAIMGKNEVTTEIPEHSDLTPASQWDSYRGLGATKWRPASSAGEENVMCAADDPYKGESILLHEFIHGIGRTGAKFLKWGDQAQEWDDYLGDKYKTAKAAGLWRDTYAMTNKIEFFAEISQSFFDGNQLPHNKEGCCTTDPNDSNCNDGIHNCVNTRAKLQGYDSASFAFLNDFWKAPEAWTPGGNDDTCACPWQRTTSNGDSSLTENYVELDENGDAVGGTEKPAADEADENGCTSCCSQGGCSAADCRSWASSGECTRNSGYMASQCAEFCEAEEEEEEPMEEQRYEHLDGYMAFNAQHNLVENVPTAPMTVEAAKAWCTSDSRCRGFTHWGSPNGEKTMHFKGQGGVSVWGPNSGWSSYKKAGR